jgi:RNA polymerase sigma-B factor
VKAVDRWDPDRGFAFSSFAVPTMLGELRRHFRDAGWLVRPPRDIQELALAVERAISPMGATLGRAPAATELAERLGRSPEAIQEAMQAVQGRSARPLEDERSDDPEQLLAARHWLGREDEGYEAVETRVTVEWLTRGLDARTREILRLRFEEDLLQREIAERVGCSQMHVSRILRGVVERLQLRAAA